MTSRVATVMNPGEMDNKLTTILITDQGWCKDKRIKHEGFNICNVNPSDLAAKPGIATTMVLKTYAVTEAFVKKGTSVEPTLQAFNDFNMKKDSQYICFANSEKLWIAIKKKDILGGGGEYAILMLNGIPIYFTGKQLITFVNVNGKISKDVWDITHISYSTNTHMDTKTLGMFSKDVKAIRRPTVFSPLSDDPMDFDLSTSDDGVTFQSVDNRVVVKNKAITFDGTHFKNFGDVGLHIEYTDQFAPMLRKEPNGTYKLILPRNLQSGGNSIVKRLLKKYT